MNLADLREEVRERGFHYVSDARITTWLNRAYHRALEAEAWPFLEATATGPAPLTITDFMHALSVVDTTNNRALTFEDYRTIRMYDPTLRNTGTPQSWYREGDEIKVYPAQAVELDVRYLRVVPDLTAESDEPVFPPRYHYMLVDGAVAFAYRDSDNPEMALNSEEAFTQALGEAVNTLMVPNYDTGRTTAIWDWEAY